MTSNAENETLTASTDNSILAPVAPNIEFYSNRNKVMESKKNLTSETKTITKSEVKKIKKAIKKHAPAGGGKSQLIALLLCIFVGGLGIHRFYLGYIWQGVVQLLTGGGCGIWTLIDLIRIITGSLGPKDGKYDKTL